jgi:ribose transport system permease protein
MAQSAVLQKFGYRDVLSLISKFGTVLAMIIMLVVFGILAPDSFLTGENLINILDQSALTAIIASGLTLVLVVGEFDLSVGYLASLGGILATGLIVKQKLPMLIAILLTLIAAALIGIFNGILVTKARVNAVVATLGVGTVLIGLSFGYTQGSPIISVPDSFLNLAAGDTFGVHNPIVAMVIVLVILWLLLNRTSLGQRIHAIPKRQGWQEFGRIALRSRHSSLQVFALPLQELCWLRRSAVELRVQPMGI